MNIKNAIPKPGLYLVRRTSYAASRQPCAGASLVSVVKTDCRDVGDPADIQDTEVASRWYRRGTGHRVVGGMIVRDVGRELRWLAAVADIMAFVDTYGGCIVSRDANGFACIEIYDSHRE